MRVAYIYNPFQILIVAGLIEQGTHFQRIVIPQKLEQLVKNLIKRDNIEFVYLRDAFVSEGIFKKLFAIFENLYFYKKLIANELFVANDQSILFLAALKFADIGSVTLIDEGALEQLIIRERLSSARLIEKLKWFLLGRHMRGMHPKITNIIVNDPQRPIWEEFRVNKKISHSTPLVKIALDCLFASQTKTSFNNAVILATSPLTENKNSSFADQELSMISDLLENNSTKNFILKMHYREHPKKYKKIIDKYKNISLMNSPFNELPLQLLFSEIDKLIGFHSSVVTQFGTMFPGKAFSLSGMVESSHSKRFVLTKPNGVNFIASYKI
ncbi:MAG: hypothetical protein CMM15_10140 [Rhodospirillaceae bacterium]|nr:hypothetical protein [Rhodospirillaceae bacterium]OUU21866.1 MAG: hypothetical protein CBB97_15785 [Candidatus Endolissoclinum sp. TMED37]